MEIRTILAPATGAASEDIALRVSADLARRFSAHVRGVHIREHADDAVEVPQTVQQEVDDATLERLKREPSASATLAKRAFSQACEEVGLRTSGAGPASREATASWKELLGTPRRVITIVGKLADLIVIVHPEHAFDHRTGRFIQAALHDTGTPLLLVPKHWQGSVGLNVVVGWDRGVAAMGAIKASLGLMRKADAVTLLAAKEAARVGPNADEVVRYLKRQDIEAQAKLVQPTGPDREKALLEEAQGLSADLFVMGAYTRPRLLEMVFGGVTRYMLNQTQIPVLLRG